MKLPVYNTKGVEVKKIEVSDEIFGLKWNADLVHQAVTSILSNARTPIAHTKNRGEVRGGGKKPWQQKGTGQARHGSRRSPIWVGGGITFGPRNEKNYGRKVNKKMRAKALATVLSQKIRDNELILVESFSFAAPKTVDAKNILAALSKVDNASKLATKRKNAAIIGLSGRNVNAEKSFANFSNLLVEEVRNINPANVLNHKYLVIENAEEAMKALSERLMVTNK